MYMIFCQGRHPFMNKDNTLDMERLKKGQLEEHENFFGQFMNSFSSGQETSKRPFSEGLNRVVTGLLSVSPEYILIFSMSYSIVPLIHIV